MQSVDLPAVTVEGARRLVPNSAGCSENQCGRHDEVSCPVFLEQQDAAAGRKTKLTK
jgi:hypothetical protein